MAEQTAKLVEELCSLLDEATILSICSDYDLTKPEDLAVAREVLLSISKDVEAEEATGFNASGLGTHEPVDIREAAAGSLEDLPPASESDLRSNDGLTTTTDSSQPRSVWSDGSSKMPSGSVSGAIHINLFDGLSEGEKEAQLTEMFTSLKPIDIKLALQKSKGDASRAIDELLNMEMLEQTGQRLKGVDGFYTPDESLRTKKKKGKKKKKDGVIRSPDTANSSSTNLSEEPSAAEDAHRLDTTFLIERLDLSESDAESIYIRHGSSLGAAVLEILDNYLAMGIEHPRNGGIKDAAEVQAKKYPWIPSRYMVPIFEMTQPTRQHAVDIIEVLALYFEKPAYLKYDISYNIAASSQESHGDALEGGGLRNRTTSPRSPALPPSPRSGGSGGVIWSPPTSLQSAMTQTRDIAELRDHTRRAAAAAYRRSGAGGSSLYGQAAAYYSERAREEAARHRAAASTEAHYLVDRDSTPGRIDLHGVTVQDGVDIALERTWRWWDARVRGRERGSGSGGPETFTIVTGQGRHNADGRSPLRSSVFKALVADGWKVEVLTGQFLVTGRRR
ncbi:hypothetical protein BX600DRAFT_461626 [Xylariales sp. PMI_506]|nr:hypothetical protein BX600DRAFT_461626 [Xylariales sp. PMI_506]